MKRDASNQIIAGVCSGLANEFGVDPTIMRAAFTILALMGFGIPIVLYIVLAIIMPKE